MAAAIRSKRRTSSPKTPSRSWTTRESAVRRPAFRATDIMKASFSTMRGKPRGSSFRMYASDRAFTGSEIIAAILSCAPGAQGDRPGKRAGVVPMPLEVRRIVAKVGTALGALQGAGELSITEDARALRCAEARHGFSASGLAVAETVRGTRPGSSFSVRPSTSSTASTLSRRTVGLLASSSYRNARPHPAYLASAASTRGHGQQLHTIAWIWRQRSARDAG